MKKLRNNEQPSGETESANIRIKMREKLRRVGRDGGTKERTK